MTNEGIEKLMAVVPQTYGEAIQLYPWIDCPSHEWDNRTTLENAAWLIGCFASQPTNSADAEVCGICGGNGFIEDGETVTDCICKRR